MSDDSQRTVFISYRRETSKHFARGIFKELRARGFDVFFDFEGLDSGVFERVILAEIGRRAHFLFLVAPGTLEICREPGDWVMREYREALRLKRNIVPVLDEVEMRDVKANLVGDLEMLSQFQAVRYCQDYETEFYEKLCERFLKAPRHIELTEPASAAQQREVERIMREAEKAVEETAPTERSQARAKPEQERIARGEAEARAKAERERVARVAARAAEEQAHQAKPAQAGERIKLFEGKDLPVESLDWEMANEFCRKLTQMNIVEGDWHFALPTEAQWEYACRAGTTTPFSFGAELNGAQANCDGNYPYGKEMKGSWLQKTTPVGKYGPNAWGLVDMHGNVWEWCADWYGEYANGAATDPAGPETGSVRVLRGGSWCDFAGFSRSAYRSGCVPGFRHRDLGLRPALVPSGA